MKRLLCTLTAIGTLSFGVACSDSTGVTGGVPRPGTLMVGLTTTHGDDGAVLFEVSGPPIDGAAAASAWSRLFTRRADASTMAGVLIGSLESGDVVALQVPDVDAASRYSARVIEVADRANALRESLGSYALTIRPLRPR